MRTPLRNISERDYIILTSMIDKTLFKCDPISSNSKKFFEKKYHFHLLVSNVLFFKRVTKNHYVLNSGKEFINHLPTLYFNYSLSRSK